VATKKQNLFFEFLKKNRHLQQKKKKKKKKSVAETKTRGQEEISHLFPLLLFRVQIFCLGFQKKSSSVIQWTLLTRNPVVLVH